MLKCHYLWLLLCYAQYVRSNLIEEFETLLNPYAVKARVETLPVELGIDKSSGCNCRADSEKNIVDCFGGYQCERFPKIKTISAVLRVRTSVIKEIRSGDLDNAYFLEELEIDANHHLHFIEPGSFKKLHLLQKLSISFSPEIRYLHENTFEGLINLTQLKLVSNGFENVLDVSNALRPAILPALQFLDLSGNLFESIEEDSFLPMTNSNLSSIAMFLCQTSYIHAKSFLPLRQIEKLLLGENYFNTSLIGNIIIEMKKGNITLTDLDLTGMGYRKHLSRKLLDIIAKTTIKRLVLSHNQFEVIPDDTFPTMLNIEVLDLRNINAVSIGPNAFEPKKFPKLKALFLGGNNLPGIHGKHLSSQLKILDLSYNTYQSPEFMYYEISRDTFLETNELLILNLSFNRIKSIQNYTFIGLEILKYLNLESGSLYSIGPGTFNATRQLEYLNLANNPLSSNGNITSGMFEGLIRLKTLILSSCGIKYLDRTNNIFNMMPNLKNLTLRNNQLIYISPDLLRPLKQLQVLDLSQNLLVPWVNSLFNETEVRPQELYVENNKISLFSIEMLEDISYLLDKTRNSAIKIDFADNIFVCDCNSMYSTYIWLEVNGSYAIKQYFKHSKFQCSSPELWEDRQVSDYLKSIKVLNCIMYSQISNVLLMSWFTPTIILIIIVLVAVSVIYKYKIYITYWMFLAKLALGRRFIRSSLKTDYALEVNYKYDAFVSYCNDDKEFVYEMIHQLENNSPYLKLCVYERDFELGSFISESILKSINESKYIVLIISNGFAKSQWCRWETQLAEYHRLFSEVGSVYDPLVLIRMGEVDSKYLNTTLKYLLKTKIYLTWNDNSDSFWAKLRNLLMKNS